MGTYFISNAYSACRDLCCYRILLFYDPGSLLPWINATAIRSLLPNIRFRRNFQLIQPAL